MNTLRLSWGIVIALAVIVLVIVGRRVSPPSSTPTARESDRTCAVDAPDALRAAAERWCANGLVSRVGVTVDERNVVMAVQFSPNGAQTFQLQSASIVNTFRTLTEEMAAASPGRDVSVAVQGAANHRVVACARLRTDASATCKEE